MAVPIASTAIKISALTDGLKADMARAGKIVEGGTKNMMNSEQQYQNMLQKRAQSIQTNKRMEKDLAAMGLGPEGKRSAWGNAFRSVFAMAVFKRGVDFLRQGAKAMEESGDAAGLAASQGLKAYDDALNRISATLAKAFAPTIGFVAERMAALAEAVESLIDVFQFEVFGDGLVAEMARRDELSEKLKKELALKEQIKKMKPAEQDLNQLGKFFEDQAESMKGPVEKHLDFTGKVLQHFFGAGNRLKDFQQGNVLIEHDFQKLLKTMGLAAELDPFEKWTQSLDELYELVELGMLKMGDFNSIVLGSGDRLLASSGLAAQSPLDAYMEAADKLNMVRERGQLTEERYAQLLGIQVQKLGESNKKLAERPGPPEALIRGSAAAFSAMNAFARGTGETKQDAAAVIKQAAKEQAERDKVQIQLGREANKHLQKFADIKVVGP